MLNSAPRLVHLSEHILNLAHVHVVDRIAVSLHGAGNILAASGQQRPAVVEHGECVEFSLRVVVHCDFHVVSS